MTMTEEWKKIYSKYFRYAGKFFVERRFEELSRLFELMRGQIYDENAKKELVDYENKLDAEFKQNLAAIARAAESETDPLKRLQIYKMERAFAEERAKKLLMFHQDLAKKYALLKGGSDFGRN